MSIATELEAAQTNLAEIKSAIESKGGTVGNTGLAGVPDEIASIPSGAPSKKAIFTYWEAPIGLSTLETTDYTFTITNNDGGGYLTFDSFSTYAFKMCPNLSTSSTTMTAPFYGMYWIEFGTDLYDSYLVSYAGMGEDRQALINIGGFSQSDVTRYTGQTIYLGEAVLSLKNTTTYITKDLYNNTEVKGVKGRNNTFSSRFEINGLMYYFMWWDDGVRTPTNLTYFNTLTLL